MVNSPSGRRDNNANIISQQKAAHRGWENELMDGVTIYFIMTGVFAEIPPRGAFESR